MGVATVPVKLHFQFLALTLVLIALAAYGAVRYAGHNNATSQTRLPAIYFYDKSERQITLDSFQGKVVLVNLWASWCLPCVVELPALDRMQGQLPGDKFRVVAISMDKSSLQEIRGFLNARGVKNLDVYWDKDRQAPLKWRYEGLPTSFLLDRNGAMVKRYDGPYEWDREPLLQEIGALLK